MLQKIFSKEPVNTGRQKEIDLIKTFSISGQRRCIPDQLWQVREADNMNLGSIQYFVGETAFSP